MDLPGCKFDIVREVDFVEYFLYPKLSTDLKPHGHFDNESALQAILLENLHNFREQCLGYVETLVKERNYIWHKDGFNLKVCNNEDCVSNVEYLPHLHGITHYGDNIADEWFIVFLLSQLTLEYSSCVARIVDVDGEFLLIEAAEKLPKWANPETCEKRVYIAHGYLHVLQNTPGVSNDKIQSVLEAIYKLHTEPKLYRVSEAIQNCINNRIAVFRNAASVSKEQHYQNVRIPLRVAALLRKQPDFIAPAVRAFCERDSKDIKILRSMRHFPPEECVRERVCFTRCLYAMIMHNNFVPDHRTGWKLSTKVNSEEFKEDLLGIKISCGFEILAINAKEDEKSPAWKVYLKSLTSKGYFNNLLEGSAEYQHLYAQARESFEKNNQHFRLYRNVGCEILSLLSKLNVEHVNVDKKKILPPSNSDEWLDITAAEMDETLMKRYGHELFVGSDSILNAAEFTNKLSKFLEKQSNFNGIELETEDETSDDKFQNLIKKPSMRRAYKKHPLNIEQNTGATSMTIESTQMRNVLNFEVPEDSWESNSDMDDYDNEDETERDVAAMASVETSIGKDIKEYMFQMDCELANTIIGKSFEKTSKQSGSNSSDDDFDDIESFKPININVNTLKNMMESYNSQFGGPGPASNFLSVMGIGMSDLKKTEDPKSIIDLTDSSV